MPTLALGKTFLALNQNSRSTYKLVDRDEEAGCKFDVREVAHKALKSAGCNLIIGRTFEEFPGVVSGEAVHINDNPFLQKSSLVKTVSAYL
jgi:hypothetical protein